MLKFTLHFNQLSISRLPQEILKGILKFIFFFIGIIVQREDKLVKEIN